VVGAVGQPVQGAPGQHRVGEERVPVPRRPAARANQAARPEPLADQLVDVLGLGGVNSRITRSSRMQASLSR
jgi:hypothetical protein